MPSLTIAPLYLNALQVDIFNDFPFIISDDSCLTHVGQSRKSLLHLSTFIIISSTYLVLDITCTQVSLSVCIMATTRYLAIVLLISRPLHNMYCTCDYWLHCPHTHLSSCPSRQVEMKRQQEPGQGMDLY